MPSLPPALLRELGQGAVGLDGVATDTAETTPELVYPLNLAVYDRMRRTDPGVRAGLRAMVNPIVATPWGLNPRNCRPVVVATVAHELGLLRDSTGSYVTRERGVSWLEFLQHLLLDLTFGHSVFEQVYEVGPWDLPGVPAQTLAGLGQAVHLHKLAPRLPRTLDGFDVAPDGALRGVWQQIVVDRRPKRVFIPIDKLVVSTNEREGADWAGQSVLRSAYKHWFMLDALYRSSAIGADRQSMGVPVVTYPSDAGKGAKALALDIAANVRTGDDSGVALEEGWTLALIGVQGGTVDPVPLISLHQQQLSKAMMSMFLDLGHDAGARNLGQVFIDQLVNAQNAKRVNIEALVTDHVIRDFVRYAFGPDEPWPSLVGQRIHADDPTVLTTLSELSSAGLLGAADAATVDAVRQRVGLPPVATTGAPSAGTTQPPSQLTPPSGDVIPGTVVTPGSAAVVAPAPVPGQPAVAARPSPRVAGVPAARQPVVAASANSQAGQAEQGGALSDLAATLGRVQQLVAALAPEGQPSP